ncbi:MAG: hypothetical protein PHQ18_02465 [Patescibacteria group bacterium]|nr:hypothetical protein [Patescibacteria group bacterium]
MVFSEAQHSQEEKQSLLIALEAKRVELESFGDVIIENEGHKTYLLGNLSFDLVEFFKAKDVKKDRGFVRATESYVGTTGGDSQFVRSKKQILETMHRTIPNILRDLMHNKIGMGDEGLAVVIRDTRKIVEGLLRFY